MKLYRTQTGAVVEEAGRCFALADAWDALINHDDLAAHLRSGISAGKSPVAAPRAGDLRAPIGNQEIWAAGVTYLRSKVARMEESQTAGGSDFYDRVYEAPRPEIFFKATAGRVAAPHQAMRLRGDSKWIVPEPELTLVINRRGKIIGYTAGNDLSCRDIEGENPLYLPQAKVFKDCASVGPGILVADQPPPPSTTIKLEILRGGKIEFTGATSIDRLKRKLTELVDWLFRENVFEQGVLLMTGTGIVPPDGFCLKPGDEVRIEIQGIGTLVNGMK